MTEEQRKEELKKVENRVKRWHESVKKVQELQKNWKVSKGAPKPAPTSPLWNDWASNNPTPQTLTLKNANLVGLLNSRGILGSAARSIQV